MINFSAITALIISAAHKTPLPWFVFGGSFVEEIISPIPTYAVMVTAGSVAHFQERMVLTLLLLAALSSLGKTLASLIYYTLADVVEDVLVPRFGKYIGVTHADVEAMGARLGARRGDYWLLIGLRAMPIIPSVPVSVVAGLIKVDRNLFLWTTFVGTTIKNLFYLVIGYYGLEAVRHMLREARVLREVFFFGLILCVGAIIAWFAHKKYIKDKKKAPPQE